MGGGPPVHGRAEAQLENWTGELFCKRVEKFDFQLLTLDRTLRTSLRDHYVLLQTPEQATLAFLPGTLTFAGASSRRSPKRLTSSSWARDSRASRQLAWLACSLPIDRWPVSRLPALAQARARRTGGMVLAETAAGDVPAWATSSGLHRSSRQGWRHCRSWRRVRRVGNRTRRRRWAVSRSSRAIPELRVIARAPRSARSGKLASESARAAHRLGAADLEVRERTSTGAAAACSPRARERSERGKLSVRNGLRPRCPASRARSHG